MDDDDQRWLQLFGLLGRACVFCEAFEAHLRNEFLPATAAMHDVAPKLEMFRSIAVGLYDFCQGDLNQPSLGRQSPVERDRAGTRHSEKAGPSSSGNEGGIRCSPLNSYFLDLFLGLCGTAVASFATPQTRSRRGEWSETEASDRLAEVTCHAGHCLSALRVWQEALATKVAVDRSELWEDVAFQFPIACDPTLTVRGAIDSATGFLPREVSWNCVDRVANCSLQVCIWPSFVPQHGWPIGVPQSATRWTPCGTGPSNSGEDWVVVRRHRRWRSANSVSDRCSGSTRCDDHCFPPSRTGLPTSTASVR